MKISSGNRPEYYYYSEKTALYYFIGEANLHINLASKQNPHPLAYTGRGKLIEALTRFMRGNYHAFIMLATFLRSYLGNSGFRLNTKQYYLSGGYSSILWLRNHNPNEMSLNINLLSD